MGKYRTTSSLKFSFAKTRIPKIGNKITLVKFPERRKIPNTK